MWPWRDWVIDAFNRNMPYDRFTIEQLAGDLLPNATLDQKIATGFQRNHRINSETGSIAEEFHAENLVDRVSTLGTVWLGLTVGCARCHDHKYDPIPTREFYSLYAFFNSVDEAGNGGPAMAAATSSRTCGCLRRNWKRNSRPKTPSSRPRAPNWPRSISGSNRGRPHGRRTRSPTSRSGKSSTPRNLKADNGVTLQALPDGSVLAGGAMPPSSIYELTATTQLRNITAFRLELLPDASLPDGGSGRGAGGKGVVTLFEARIGNRKVDLGRITADFKSEESELNLVVRPADQLKRGWGVNPEMNKPHYAVIETARMQGSGEEADVHLPHRQRVRRRAGGPLPHLGHGFGIPGGRSGRDGGHPAHGGRRPHREGCRRRSPSISSRIPWSGAWPRRKSPSSKPNGAPSKTRFRAPW